MNTLADWLLDITLVVAVSAAIILAWRKFGGRSRLLLLSCLYTVGVLVITLLPIPSDPHQWCATHWDWSNPVPGRSLVGIAQLLAGGRILRAVVFAVQVLLNVVLFMPLGALLDARFGPAAADRNDHEAVRDTAPDTVREAMREARLTAVMWTMAGLAASCCIELTQATGLYGLVPCAYRIVDVDDLITNTMGAALGVIAFRRIPLVRRLLLG